MAKPMTSCNSPAAKSLRCYGCNSRGYHGQSAHHDRIHQGSVLLFIRAEIGIEGMQDSKTAGDKDYGDVAGHKNVIQDVNIAQGTGYGKAPSENSQCACHRQVRIALFHDGNVELDDLIGDDTDDVTEDSGIDQNDDGAEQY